MKPLNKKQARIFNKIIEPLNGSRSHYKLENSKSFMPLSVEKLGTYDIGTMYSFCHYFKQNGDLCQDPEMVFIKHKNGKIYPCMFQQAIPPIYQESIYFDEGWKLKPKMQADHAKFANMWLNNIKEQQNI